MTDYPKIEQLVTDLKHQQDRLSKVKNKKAQRLLRWYIQGLQNMLSTVIYEETNSNALVETPFEPPPVQLNEVSSVRQSNGGDCDHGNKLWLLVNYRLPLLTTTVFQMPISQIYPLVLANLTTTEL